MRHSRFLFATFVAVSLLASPASAQPKKPEDPAVALKRQGDEAMDALRYDEAIAFYTRAYELNGMPAALYNRGRVHQARGEYVKASDDIERFAREAPADLKTRVPELEALRAELRSHIATLSLTVNVPGARVLVRTVDVGTAPFVEPLRLDAGKARIEVTAEGHRPEVREIDLPAGRTTSLAIALERIVVRGVLVVRAANESGEVAIDGKAMGKAPVETEVPAGTHRIVMRKEGSEDVSTSAVIAPGERKEVVLRLESKPSIFGRWWFWTGATALVAGGVVATIALLTEKSPDKGDGFAPEQARAPLVRW